MKNKNSKITKLADCNVQHSMYIEEKSKEDIEQTQLLNEYKKAVDQSTIVSRTDKNGILIYVNDAFVKVSGYSKDELIGSPQNIIRHPDSPSEIFKVMWETILTQTIVSMANKLNIEIIAEFVSSKEIHDAVMSLGIDHVQGYYLGEPQPYLLEDIK